MHSHHLLHHSAIRILKFGTSQIIILKFLYPIFLNFNSIVFPHTQKILFPILFYCYFDISKLLLLHFY